VRTTRGELVRVVRGARVAAVVERARRPVRDVAIFEILFLSEMACAPARPKLGN
jgi:hypothetical protein